MTADNRVASLSHFQLKLENDPADSLRAHVYANDRQQFEVTLVIEARDANNQIIQVSAADMKNVILMDYSSEISYSGSLTRSYTKNSYDKPVVSPRGNEITQGDEITPSALSTLTFWESIKPGVTTNFHIAAKITLNGVTYTTNNPAATAGGGEVKDGRSNSSFIVQPLLPERLRADSFQIRKKLDNMGYFYEQGGLINPKRWLELWEIRFKDPNRRIHASSFPDTKPIPWFSQYCKDSKPYHCNWILPVRRGQVGSTVYLGWLRSSSEWRDIGIQPYYEDDVAYAVIESSHYISTHAYNNWGVSYIDNKGNSHHVLIHPNDRGEVLEIIDS